MRQSNGEDIMATGEDDRTNSAASVLGYAPDTPGQRPRGGASSQRGCWPAAAAAPAAFQRIRLGAGMLLDRPVSAARAVCCSDQIVRLSLPFYNTTVCPNDGWFTTNSSLSRDHLPPLSLLAGLVYFPRSNRQTAWTALIPGAHQPKTTCYSTQKPT